jgi:hypothetical protein
LSISVSLMPMWRLAKAACGEGSDDMMRPFENNDPFGQERQWSVRPDYRKLIGDAA